MEDAAEKTEFYRGLVISVTGHILLFGLLILNLSKTNNFSQGIVYSITIEGGKTLGGLSQIAKTEKEQPVAPPKNISAKTEDAEIKPQVKEEKPEVSPEKAEISLTEKKPETKPEPKKEEKKVEPKKTEAKKEEKKEKPKQEPMVDVNKDYQKAMQRYLGESTEAGGKGFGAGKVGGKGMGGGVQMPEEFFIYRQILRNRVKGGWKWYDSQAELTTWATFSIAPDGTISNVAVANSSGNKEFDDSVLRAIFKASPLPPPPEKVYEQFKDVKMSFDPRD